MVPRIIIQLFIFQCFITSCLNSSNCIKVSLTQEEKSWFNLKTLHRKLVFKDQNGVKEEFIQNGVKERYTVCNKFELSDKIYNEVSLNYKPKNISRYGNHYTGVDLFFYKNINNDSLTPCKKHLSVFDLKIIEDYDFSKCQREKILLGEGIEVDCLIFEYFINCYDIDGGTNYIKKFYWNKEYGLVRYVNFKDEIFTLDNWSDRIYSNE